MLKNIKKIFSQFKENSQEFNIINYERVIFEIKNKEDRDRKKF